MQPSRLCTVSIAAWHLNVGRYFLYGLGVSSNIPEMHYQRYSLKVSFSKTLLIYVNANRDTILTEFVHQYPTLVTPKPSYTTDATNSYYL